MSISHVHPFWSAEYSPWPVMLLNSSVPDQSYILGLGFMRILWIEKGIEHYVLDGRNAFNIPGKSEFHGPLSINIPPHC